MLIESKRKEVVFLYYNETNPSHNHNARSLITRNLFMVKHAESISVNTVKNIIKGTENFDPNKVLGKGSGAKKAATASPIKQLIKDLVTSDPRSSIRSLAKEAGISYGSVHHILTEELCLYPYKEQEGQVLTLQSRARRLNACKNLREILDQHPDFLDRIWFTDEAHVDLNGVINKQNQRWWLEEGPLDDDVRETSAHPDRITVFAAMNAVKGIIFFFFEDEEGKAITVNGDRYR